VGGGVPRGGEVLLSTTRLNDIEPVIPGSGRVIAGAGATIASAHAAARAAGLAVGVDLASRDSATVGGMIATNAGGIRVVRHGPMRAQVLGIEAVLADGSILSELDGPVHSSAGYDLVRLLAGSEGTLAILTRAALRLVQEPAHRAVALFGAHDTADAMGLAEKAKALPSLDAIELFYADGVALVRAFAGLPEPLDRVWPAYLLVECAGGPGSVDELASLLVEGDDRDVAVAVDAQERRRLWAYREEHAEAIAVVAVAHRFDVSIPLARVPEFVDAARKAIADAAPGARPVFFGHAGVGNLHIDCLGVVPGDPLLDEAVLGLVSAYGGSISAEHGIGALKRKWLHLSHSPEAIGAMRSVKRAFDPSGVLNPGVLFPPED
jgi:FAD/FMN-containing dehydrogenase